MITPSPSIGEARSMSAAVRNDIQRDYHELKSLLAESSNCLLATTCDATKHPPRQVVSTLRRLQHRLAMHFTLEEAFGYGEEELGRAPWLADRAVELRAEHDIIFAHLKAIVRTSELLLDGKLSLLKSLCTSFENFVIELHVHENQEADLLLSFFDDDVGVGD
jgi:hypothetical protein